ncbi:MAG: DUF4149 domain-containing protein [Isosphaeraceae bacterium]
MSARFLLTVFDSVYLVSLTAWVGSILFFSFAIAPIIFNVLGAESGAKFVRALFPRYYLWGAVSGSLALPAFVAGPLCFREYRGIGVAVQSMAILASILIMLYGANSLVPEINRARDAGPAGHDRFVRLHRRSVWLNSVVLIVGIGLLVSFAARPVPRSAGIVELTPTERAGYDAAVSRIIEDVEVRHGLRPKRVPDAGETPKSGPRIDDEVVKEIESYYERPNRSSALGSDATAKGRGRTIEPPDDTLRPPHPGGP